MDLKQQVHRCCRCGLLPEQRNIPPYHSEDLPHLNFLKKKIIFQINYFLLKTSFGILEFWNFSDFYWYFQNFRNFFMIIHFRGIYEIVQGGTKMMVQH